MLVQIYEVTSPEEASALAELGVDHIGVLVGDGEFPREQSVQAQSRSTAAGCRLGSLSASPKLIPEEGSAPGFDIVYAITVARQAC